MQPKPGYKTSELYVNLIAALVGLAGAYGLVSEAEASAWLALGAALVPAAVAIVYTWSRTRLKQSAANLDEAQP